VAGEVAADAAAAIAIGTDLRATRFEDAEAFLAATGDFLTAREAEHNLLLGLAGRLAGNPNLFGPTPYFAAAARGGTIVAAALRTPPHGLVLSEVDDRAGIEALANDVAEAFDELPGVLGPKAPSRRFAELWGRPARLVSSQRVYRADSVRPPDGVSGSMRRASGEDRPLLKAWIAAFQAEVPGGAHRAPEAVVDDYLSRGDDGGLYLWDADEPVSLCGYGSPTPNGFRVGPVYTPPKRRGRGYASALTAGVSSLALSTGRRFCFLFTDLANPTSNRIYQRIGYEPVTDVDEYRFSPAT
jgi:uncharacterized protein